MAHSRSKLIFFFPIRIIVLAIAVLATASGALAQYPNMAQQNMMFDQRMANQVNSMMMQNQMAQQQLLQTYIQQNGPQLRADYQQYVQTTGMQIPFEQFAYSHMATQGGRNPGPALQQQQQNFQALQGAHQTQMQGFQDYNNGWNANQQAQSNTAQRYDQQAVQGNQYYRNPQTGQVTELPYGGQQGVYQNNQGTWENDQQGQYYQVDPQGYRQQMQQFQPNGDGDD